MFAQSNQKSHEIPRIDYQDHGSWSAMHRTYGLRRGFSQHN